MLFHLFLDVTPLDLVLMVLATWRIASIIHTEEIGRGFRKIFGVDEDDSIITYPNNFFGKLISCFWCVSVWSGILVYGLFLLFPYILVPFAISTGAILIKEKVVD